MAIASELENKPAGYGYIYFIFLRVCFSFPKDPNIKNKWIEATGRKNWFPTKYSRICSIHFREDSFTRPSKYRRVIPTAYPTIDVVKISNDEKVHIILECHSCIRLKITVGL